MELLVTMLDAAKRGHEEIVKNLLTKPLLSKSNEKNRNSHDIYLDLLEGKDDAYSNYTPLLWASQKGRYGCVRILLESGANCEARDADYRCTPLLVASLNGHADVVRLLLQRGANCEAQDRNGFTPLLLAALWGRSGVVAELLKHGADWRNAKNNNGKTAMELVVESPFIRDENERRKVIALLREVGAPTLVIPADTNEDETNPLST